MKCLCCNHEFNEYESYDCPYCGFKNYETLQDRYSSDDWENADSHRKDVLSKIEKISILAETFKYNENKNEMEEIERTELFGDGTDGEKCYEDIVWSKVWIAHSDASGEISIKYRFAGAEKKVSARIALPKREGIFHLGLQISKELKLNISLRIEPLNGIEKIQIITLNTIDLDLIA